MSDYCDSAWETKGEPTTTAYGANNSGFNEMGQRLAPKPVFNLHGSTVPNRPPVDLRIVAAMVSDYHRVHGKLPRTLRVTGPKQGESFRGIKVPLIGMVCLDITYGAEFNHVA